MTTDTKRNAKMTAIDSFEGNSVVMNIGSEYYSVCTPTSNWAKNRLKNVCLDNQLVFVPHMQHQTQLELSEQGFAAIEVVPLNGRRSKQVKAPWVLKDYWNPNEPHPAGPQIYPSIGSALDAARTWYAQDPENREVILNRSVHQALTREERQQPVDRVHETASEWRQSHPAPDFDTRQARGASIT